MNIFIMGRIKKMSLVDPAMMEEMTNLRKNNMDKGDKTSSNFDTHMSNLPIAEQSNPFKYDVLQKRIFGLQKFLAGLLNHRGRQNIGYSQLRKYNEALTSLMRINKFEYDMTVDEGQECDDIAISPKVSYGIFELL